MVKYLLLKRSANEDESELESELNTCQGYTDKIIEFFFFSLEAVLQMQASNLHTGVPHSLL